ncbi:Transcriptional regulator PadR-like family protein [Anaerosphaera aminiphila DSM 21120]|uniref:Transcriptional regulator PadR-like family protein n=1 Tax=Anaerosphaera aminiphila DSM 21120 TaxID=1120995 RepID=A0A1M5PRH0_9FIRM|nr:PadR family transcriptional regulator [Anaerosphaera aminiphila]SHH04310.1 Transcriptional regulator PadR-like family protein [Anaerosphaera aminiphila DSM 21120]
MKNKIESPLTETAFLILLAMTKPNHGYGVQQFVEKKTKGRVVFGPGTLYGAINNLSKKGWIEQVPAETETRKKEYIITELGRENLNYEIKRLKESLSIADEIAKEERI